MKKEIRAFSFEVRAEENEEHGHFLTGRPIVYNSRTNLGWYDEIIESGALDGTDLRSRNNTDNSTMQMIVDSEGMSIRVDLDTENNAEAKSLYSAVSRGDISGMSFMFTVDKDAWDDIESEHPTRTIRAIGRVLEVSAVTFPAYEATSIQARGLADALDSARASLESERTRMKKMEQRKKAVRLLLEI